MTPSQAIAVASGHPILIMLVFLIGYLLHAGLQINAVARAKNNPINTRIGVIEQNAIPLASRLFISTMIFFGAWAHPSLVPAFLGYCGLSISSNATAILTIPMSPWIAGIFGFSIDSLLAYIPFLKNSLPPINGALLAAK